MKKKLILLFILLLMPFSANALEYEYTPSNFGEFSYNEYLIDSYDIQIEVHDDNVLSIKETIQTYFNVNKHGIFRKIPTRNNVIRLDGSSYTNRGKLSNLLVSENYEYNRGYDYHEIKIGDANTTLIGAHTYTIEYTYNIGNDKTKDYDELYFNIIGTEWDTYIGNVTFSIIMPKDFDEEKLGFSSGIYGLTDNELVSYQVDGNVINGSYNGILAPYNGLTVRLELPEGYFEKQKIDYSSFAIYIMPFICVIISYILWNVYGKDDKPVETVEFYPPRNMNSAEVELLYKGTASNKGIISLLVYLANQGYIKITEFNEKGLFGTTKSFELTKLKEYAGNNPYEELFMSELFKTSNVVKKEDLEDSFYTSIAKISSKLNSKENKNQIYEKTASSKKWFLVLMMVLSFFIGVSKLDFDTIFVVLFTSIFVFIGLFIIISSFIDGDALGKIFGLIFGGFFGGMPFVMQLVTVFGFVDFECGIGYLFSMICIFIMIFFFVIMPKRTPYGTEMLGKIGGFRNFLKTAEKERLERMVNDDPTYFYNILPYTYALDVTSEWMKKFEDIAVKTPDWYDSPNAFDYASFNTFMTSTMTSINSAMTSSPSSSSGGSGGGFSGGGSGGGGGGSW